MPDPLLKQAAEEIKAVLRKHDIAAIVLLGSPTHSEYVYEFCPSWSCATLDGERLRIKAKRTEFTSPDAQKKCVEATTGIFCAFRTLCAEAFLAMEGIIKELGRHFDISHFDKRE